MPILDGVIRRRILAVSFDELKAYIKSLHARTVAPTRQGDDRDAGWTRGVCRRKTHREVITRACVGPSRELQEVLRERSTV